MCTQRIAVATVFICIGILLLSACGLPLRSTTRPRPQVVGTIFALYTADHTLLATGSISTGTDLQNLNGSLTFATCREARYIPLTGTLNPTLALYSAFANGTEVKLLAKTSPTYQPSAIFTNPFRGTLSSSGPCGDFKDVEVVAENAQHTP